MNTLQIHSKWISNNIKLSAEKTMSKLLSIVLKDILKYSQKHQWDNMSPRPAHHFYIKKIQLLHHIKKYLRVKRVIRATNIVQY
jgi:hypothetical protein